MLPQATRLLAPYPNPFNPFTQIVFELAQGDRVQLSVYNSLGQEVRRLVEEEWWPGVYRVVWDGRDEGGQAVGRGVYFWRLQSGEGQQSRKMLLLR
jgi:flagellar hook assembly protein FlgD